MSNPLPTLNQYLGPGGQYPKTVPGYSTVPEQNNQQPPQGNWNQPPQGNWNQPPQGNWNQPPQGNWNQSPQGNWNQPPQEKYNQPPQGNWNQPPQEKYNQPPQGNWNQPPQGNWNQPPQGNWNQPPQEKYNQPPQGNWNQPPQGNWNQPPQENWNQPQQGNWNQPQQGNWNVGYSQQPGYYNNFSNEIYSLRSQYGMQIPDNQIDQTLEAAKANKRMYPFPEKEKTYLRYDQKGKSYILSAHAFTWAHKDNSQYFTNKNDQAAYDGTTSYLIKVCWLNMKLPLKHIKPGNYQLFFNQAFENAQIRGQMKVRVLVMGKEVFKSTSFPNEEMIKSRRLTEHYICKIRREDFDYNKLDNNGDGHIIVEIEGNNQTWKKGWTFDGFRLLEC